VLAVGDAKFQKKCLGKMGQVAKSGRTVLFVSHNMAAIRKLCSKSILIESGELKAIGQTDSIVNTYLNASQSADSSDLANKSRRGLGKYRLADVTINNSNGGNVLIGNSMTLHFEFNSSMKNYRFIFTMYNSYGVMVSYYDTKMRNDSDDLSDSTNSLTCRIDRLLLVPGRYYVNTCLSVQGEMHDHVHAAASFEVVENIVDGRVVGADMQGMMVMPHEWISS